MKNAEQIKADSPVVLSTGGKPITQQDIERLSKDEVIKLDRPLWVKYVVPFIIPGAPDERIVCSSGGRIVTQQDIMRPKQLSKRDFDRLHCAAGWNKGTIRTKRQCQALMRILFDILKK